jgi:NADP-dependent 3-hydroxy acid dehydrogenase YdfG
MTSDSAPSIVSASARRPGEGKLAVVTGASSGIGAAAARQLAAAGFQVVAGARRVDRLRQELPDGAVGLPLDVTSEASVAAFAEQVPSLHVLVNNAGKALGVESVEDADLDKWEEMYQTNVLGVLRMTKALLPALEASGDGHLIQVGSIAGFETYPGGAGYTASKHAQRALSHTLRLELLGRPIRVTEINPGLVDTEFSKVRFGGDQQRADSVYRGMEPLTGDDVAECIVWAATRPPHVNIDEILVRPRDQARATLVHRRSEGD